MQLLHAPSPVAWLGCCPSPVQNDSLLCPKLHTRPCPPPKWPVAHFDPVALSSCVVPGLPEAETGLNLVYRGRHSSGDGCDGVVVVHSLSARCLLTAPQDCFSDSVHHIFVAAPEQPAFFEVCACLPRTAHRIHTNGSQSKIAPCRRSTSEICWMIDPLSALPAWDLGFLWILGIITTQVPKSSFCMFSPG